ncbi:MAG: hypothetical protein E3J56_01100 [Candidatus Aminicenantes bacterium]|nr:MAG: hypothetical protein E3J56_01100 [Candidatus Aminicenantes bacterium]
MVNKAEMKEKLKKMAQAKCAYPGCKKRQMMTVSLQIISLLESGKIFTPYTGKDSAMNIGVPLCTYHFRIAAAGLLAVMEKRNKHYVHGPFDIIKVAEAVFDAKEFSKSIQEEPEVKKNA